MRPAGFSALRKLPQDSRVPGFIQDRSWGAAETADAGLS